MSLRAFGLAFLIVLFGAATSFAQRPTGPATLENLLTPDELQSPPAAATQRPVAVEAAESNAPEGPPSGRPQGTLVRPKDGVKHPELDKAWADYDAAVAKATEGIKAAIARQFDAAADKGDLDGAERWDLIRRNLETKGTLPVANETKTAVNAAKRAFASSGLEIHKAYAELVKTLTKAQNLVESRAVADEGKMLTGDPQSAKAKADSGSIKSPEKKFLTDLVERGFNAGPERSFSKDGVTPEGNPLSVRGIKAPHAIWLHPPTNGFSVVTFDIPNKAVRIVGAVAMNDSTQDQRTPLTFMILDGAEKVLWSSKPIKGRGAEQVFDVPLGKSKSIILKVVCPGDWRFAHAVWVDPYFLCQ